MPNLKLQEGELLMCEQGQKAVIRKEDAPASQRQKEVIIKIIEKIESPELLQRLSDFVTYLYTKE